MSLVFLLSVVGGIISIAVIISMIVIVINHKKKNRDE